MSTRTKDTIFQCYKEEILKTLNKATVDDLSTIPEMFRTTQLYRYVIRNIETAETIDEIESYLNTRLGNKECGDKERGLLSESLIKASYCRIELAKFELEAIKSERQHEVNELGLLGSKKESRGT